MMLKSDTLPAIWEVPDDLWEQIHPVIAEMDPAISTGLRRSGPRRVLDGIIFRMRTRCQWNRLPGEMADDSTIHRTFQRWVELGVLERIWTVLVEEWRNWAAWIGNGKLPIAPWAKQVWGGLGGRQPHGPGQGWQQAEHPG